MSENSGKKYEIAMFPWFAIGHMTPFLHLSNELAKRGHYISFLLPKKAQIQLENMNLYPDHITFHAIKVPHVEGLPHGTETASEIPIFLTGNLATAMDLTSGQVKALLFELKPDFVFYDTAHWIPELASGIGFKTVCYNVVSAASLAIAVVPARKIPKDRPITDEDLMEPPEGYPSSKILLRKHEARSLSFISREFGEGITFYERVSTAMKLCDAISIRTCRELEGHLCDYLGSQFEKPMILTGPVLPNWEANPSGPKKDGLVMPVSVPEVSVSEPPVLPNWLDKFAPRSVVFCAFGSQWILEKDQFQELVLGFELTGFPFVVALKPPNGFTKIEDALPEGFQERIKGRGLICGGVVPQIAILNHPSVGCFVSHCGFGSMWESLMSHSQIVLVPHLGDQILNTRLLADELEVALEVERDENGWFSKESLCKAICCAMDKDSKVGNLVRENHAKWKDTILRPNFMSDYIDEFIKKLDEI